MTTNIVASEQSPSLDLLDSHVEAFVGYLRAAGYAKRTLRKKRPVVVSFARWTMREELAVEELDHSHIVRFISRLHPRQRSRITLERATLRSFLRYLRTEGKGPNPLPQSDNSPVNELKGQYLNYLRKERGLTENSILVYAPMISDFLTDQMARRGCISPQALDAAGIREFLLKRTRHRSSEYSRLMATSLRSFFRFLYLHGETTIDLSLTVPRVCRWRQANVPAFLSPEEVERTLSAPDRSTPRGRRDHAILLLLARLGLRAGEVVTLELGDIDWRAGEILVRGKGQLLERLPLPWDVGEALSVYLDKDRGTHACRRVFLRMFAPRVGLAGPVAVGHIVRGAFATAGLHFSGRGATHRFRHSLATAMIRHGASMKQIAEVLRHRSQNTTAIYAKVDFEALRTVARPWPTPRGVQ